MNVQVTTLFVKSVMRPTALKWGIWKKDVVIVLTISSLNVNTVQTEEAPWSITKPQFKQWKHRICSGNNKDKAQVISTAQPIITIECF